MKTRSRDSEGCRTDRLMVQCSAGDRVQSTDGDGAAGEQKAAGGTPRAAGKDAIRKCIEKNAQLGNSGAACSEEQKKDLATLSSRKDITAAEAGEQVASGNKMLKRSKERQTNGRLKESRARRTVKRRERRKGQRRPTSQSFVRSSPQPQRPEWRSGWLRRGCSVK